MATQIFRAIIVLLQKVLALFMSNMSTVTMTKDDFGRWAVKMTPA